MSTPHGYAPVFVQPQQLLAYERKRQLQHTVYGPTQAATMRPTVSEFFHDLCPGYDHTCVKNYTRLFSLQHWEGEERGGVRVAVAEERGGVRVAVAEERGGVRVAVAEERGGVRVAVAEERGGVRVAVAEERGGVRVAVAEERGGV